QNIDMNLFWQVWDKLDQQYLIKDDVNPQAMVWGAIKGMTAALGDPYTVFLPPKDNKSTQEELDGAFEGVGIQLGFKDNNLAVVAPLSGTPAEAAGIKAGDYIVHIKDESKKIDTDTVDMSLPEAVEIIRGEQGTSVILTLIHEGETEPVTVTIKRDTIVIKSVELTWVGDDQQVALLKLSRFGGRTEEEWNEAVKQITGKGSGLRGVILDLRNNPGGYLQGAVRYAGEFLPLGTIVVKQADATGAIDSYSVTDAGKLTKVPLVVLVNQGSASSSEILAGALKDHQRAKLVGVKTFGKGTIQEALDLGDGAGLHITSAKWLTPSGTWVNDTEGLEPDLNIELNTDTPEVDNQLTEALKLL
ncbi:MAG TPA: S41 family peptidase, partial [Patescibacteria group bacterium]|nr:S41 family peptidase [Patescibacteria group bacterium]